MTAYGKQNVFFFTSASDPARAIRGGIPPSCPIAMLIETPKGYKIITKVLCNYFCINKKFQMVEPVCF